jgi:2-succinyl-5-enolpyruvyl-6-hydroxy-3-cyclohexene-1-carboxylate synthase
MILKNEAISISIGQGPVHINAPFEEPLYETVSELSVPVTVIASAKCRTHFQKMRYVSMLRFGITQQKIGLSGRE